ncbi:hypothetical protein [Metallosphaera sp.]|uniref:hypothetical protein n=1 Tax=Metallosphaera sp. TaxID=2020860 RepID=UPI00316A4A1D
MSVTLFRDLSMYKKRAQYYLINRKYVDDIPLNNGDDVLGTVIFLKIPEAEEVLQSFALAKGALSNALTSKMQTFIQNEEYAKAEEVSELIELIDNLNELEEKFKTISVAYVLSAIEMRGDLEIDIKSTALDLMEAIESAFLKSIPYLDDVGDLGKIIDNMRFSVEKLKGRIKGSK